MKTPFSFQFAKRQSLKKPQKLYLQNMEFWDNSLTQRSQRDKDPSAHLV